MHLISVKHEELPEEPLGTSPSEFASNVFQVNGPSESQQSALADEHDVHDMTAVFVDERIIGEDIIGENDHHHADNDAITKVSAALLGYELDEADATMVMPSAVLMGHDDLRSHDAASSGDRMATVPAEASELLAMIRDELHGNLDSMHQSLEHASAAALAGDTPTLEEYRWQVERLGNASQSLGLAGLYHFLSRIVEATCLVDSAPPAEVMACCEVLDRWPSLVMNYLDDISQPAHAQSLCDYLMLAEFPMPMNAAAANIVLQELTAPDWSVLQSQMPTRETTATPEMVSLQFADDINQALLDSLLQELPAQTQELSTAIQQVLANGDVEAVQLAQRVAHTLKGAANTVGIRGIAEVSHCLEDILIVVGETGTLSTGLSSLIQDASDCLEAMSEALLGVGESPPQALDVLQSMLDWIADPETHAKTNKQVELAEENSAADSFTEEISRHAEPAHEDVAPVADSTPLLRVPMTQVDDLLRLSGESKIVGSQLKEGMRRVETQLQGVRRQNQLLQQLVNELEQLVDIRGVSAPMIRAGNTDFDALEMDQYGELHTLSRRLAEVAVDSRQWNAAAQGEVDALEELLLSQAQQHNEAQDSILKMRMVPASTIVSRLQRAVRQTCRLLDKQAQLTVQGENTLIDSDSLNQLIDPLMHLLRNAIDHGMEAADERVTLGKEPQGRLHIDFGRDGNQIVVRVKDDGRGLNYAAIHATAMDRGMLQPGAIPTENQLARMILLPGFSTRSEVTQVSGRGIGLDVVHDRVLKLKGTLDVRSVAGQFCEFIIRLPASLLSAHALLIRNGKHTVAIVSRGIRQIVDSRAIKLSSMDNRLLAQIGDEVYETHRLEGLLGTTVNRRGNERGARPALLVEISADRVVAILVQAVLDTVDLVVKPLGKYVPSSIGVVGATILGDGSVAPVMDIPELLRERVAGDYQQTASMSSDIAHDRQHQIPTVLVVDDSLSVRRAMEQLLRDSGYEVRLARDGLEAVSIMQGKRPDVMLVDMEMPRMNGIELATHVRNSPGLKDVPIIMITSRSTDKHRRQATTAGVNLYMTKPYAEDELLRRISQLISEPAAQ